MTLYHCALDVRGTLKTARKRELAQMFKRSDGTRLTADEAKDVLMDHIAQGHEVIPCGPCANFDFQKGCLGHETIEDTHG